MSHKCRLRSYKSIGDDGKWAADRIEQLEAELANIKEVEFPKRVAKVAESWRGKCERLEAENAALREGFGEPAAWRIKFKSVEYPDFLTVRYHGTNAIADYRQIDPDAVCEPLYARKETK